MKLNVKRVSNGKEFMTLSTRTIEEAIAQVESELAFEMKSKEFYIESEELYLEQAMYLENVNTGEWKYITKDSPYTLQAYMGDVYFIFTHGRATGTFKNS